MPSTFNTEENKKLMDWVAGLQSGPTAVASPTPETPASPALAPTNTGAEANMDKMADESRIQDSNPGHSPQDLAGYIKSQEGEIDKYGPDQEKAVFDSIQKSHGSIGSRLARGGASIGDALMAVAGKGSPGFLSNLESREARIDAQALNETPRLQEMNMKNLGAKQGLESMTSSTPLGGSTASALGPIFEKMGIPPADIPKMLENPAAARSVLEPLAAMAGAEQKIKIESMLKQMELEQRSQQSELQGKREQDETERKALDQLSDIPWYSRILHRDETNALKEKAGLTQPEGHGIPELGGTFNGKKVLGVRKIK